jgi:Family of unknown function (DUF5681)
MMDDDNDGDGRSGGDGFTPDRPWDPEVGYGRPPKATQFKPGQSGNPKGRPKGAKTRRFASGGHNLRDALLAEMERIIVIQEGDQQVEMTQLQAVLRRLMIMAMKGDIDAIRMLLRYAEQMQREDRQLHERLLEQMLKYKVKAEAELQQRQAKGITDISDILPHPDHIDVDFVTGEVLITGPMSPAEAAAIEAGHEALLEQRKALAQLDTLDPTTLPGDLRQSVAQLRHGIETQIRALSEALGEPYP